MRHVEWIESRSTVGLGQAKPDGVMLRDGDVYVFGVEMHKPCREISSAQQYYGGLSHTRADYRWKSLNGYMQVSVIDRKRPGWLGDVPMDRIDLTKRPILGGERCMIWFKAKYKGKSQFFPTRALRHGNREITVFSSFGSSKYTVPGDVTDILDKQGNYLLKSEWYSVPGAQRDPSQPPPAERPSDYVDVDQSGIPSGTSPVPGIATPRPGSQPPPGQAPTGPPEPPKQGKQLYVIDPATGSGRPVGEPQPMTHTDVRANIEATARRPNAPLMGYGEAGTGTPNYGIYDTRQTPPRWSKPVVQTWYFDNAAKTWVSWGEPAPVVPQDLKRLLEAVVNQGTVVGTGWSAPGATQPIAVYREGQWQPLGLVQLWVQRNGQWVKVGVPVIRTLTGTQKDVEAAVAAGSPPLGVSGDGAAGPTFVYDGQWRQFSAPVEEAGAPPKQVGPIPGVEEGTAPLPPGISPTIPNVAFPMPAMPGVPANVVASAVDSIQRAAVACPGLATADGALQHALSAFGVFAALSVAQGLRPETNLDVLHAELDKLCPQWRGTEPDDQPPATPPPPPPEQQDVVQLLGQVALALAGAATTMLPTLYNRANEMGLPGLAEQVRQYAEQSGDPIPEAEPPPPEEPPPSPPATTPPDEEPPPDEEEKKAKKKGMSGLAVAGLVALGIGAAILIGS